MRSRSAFPPDGKSYPCRPGLRSRQRSAKSARCHPQLAAKDGGKMALVDKPGLLRDPREGLVGAAHQASLSREPTLHGIALRPNPSRFFERPAEVIGAQTGN